MKTDRTTKILLLLIALGLWGLLLRPVPTPAQATSGVVDMNIAQVGGRNISVSVMDGTVMASPLNGLKIEFRLVE